MYTILRKIEYFHLNSCHYIARMCSLTLFYPGFWAPANPGRAYSPPPPPLYNSWLRRVNVMKTSHTYSLLCNKHFGKKYFCWRQYFFVWWSIFPIFYRIISRVLNVIFKFCLRVMKGIAMLYNILVGFLVTLHWFRDTRSQTFTKKKREKKDFLHIFKIHVPSWYFEEGCHNFC